MAITVRAESIDVTEIDKTINSNRVLKAFQPYRRSAFNQQIALGVNPYGEGLTPLSDRYARAKLKKYGRRPIRVASGETRRTYKSRIVGNQLVEELGGRAILHQEGDPRIGLPQRLYLPTQERGMSAQDQDKLLDLAITEIERAFRRAKRK